MLFRACFVSILSRSSPFGLHIFSSVSSPHVMMNWLFDATQIDLITVLCSVGNSLTNFQYFPSSFLFKEREWVHVMNKKIEHFENGKRRDWYQQFQKRDIRKHVLILPKPQRDDFHLNWSYTLWHNRVRYLLVSVCLNIKNGSVIVNVVCCWNFLSERSCCCCCCCVWERERERERERLDLTLYLCF
jgi:hypothetical protein